MNPEVQVQRALKALADHDRIEESQVSAHAIFARRSSVPRRGMSRRNLGIVSALTLLTAAFALFLTGQMESQIPPQPQPERGRRTGVVLIDDQRMTPGIGYVNYAPVDFNSCADCYRK
jgi:hypothetical protein